MSEGLDALAGVGGQARYELKRTDHDGSPLSEHTPNYELKRVADTPSQVSGNAPTGDGVLKSPLEEFTANVPHYKIERTTPPPDIGIGGESGMSIFGNAPHYTLVAEGAKTADAAAPVAKATDTSAAIAPVEAAPAAAVATPVASVAAPEAVATPVAPQVAVETSPTLDLANGNTIGRFSDRPGVYGRAYEQIKGLNATPEVAAAPTSTEIQPANIGGGNQAVATVATSSPVEAAPALTGTEETLPSVTVTAKREKAPEAPKPVEIVDRSVKAAPNSTRLADVKPPPISVAAAADDTYRGRDLAVRAAQKARAAFNHSAQTKSPTFTGLGSLVQGLAQKLHGQTPAVGGP